MTVGPSDNLRIAVNENPGTGFRWTAEVADNGTLEVLSSNYMPATSLRLAAAASMSGDSKLRVPAMSGSC